jgi:hypothetical protein
MNMRIDPNHAAKVDAGLVEGNLKHMMDRVSGFQNAREEKKKASGPVILTKETAAAEHQAKELEKFVGFTEIFGHLMPNPYSKEREMGVLSAPKEWKYDITEWTDPSGKPMQEIRYRNIQVWWPIRIMQQLYAWSERKVIVS